MSPIVDANLNLHLMKLFYYPIFLLGMMASQLIAFWSALFQGFGSRDWITQFNTQSASYKTTIIDQFLY
eukprot:403350371